MYKGLLSLKEQNIFEKILSDLKSENINYINDQELDTRFKAYKCFVRKGEFSKLGIRRQLIDNNIVPKNLKSEEKILFIKKFIEFLQVEGIELISNSDFISQIKKKFHVTIREGEFTKLGIRNKLESIGVTLKKQIINNKKQIINNTINHILKNNIEMETVQSFLKEAKKFGDISRGSIDNYLDHIQQQIKFKNLKNNQRTKFINMSDKQIIIKVAQYYLSRNIKRIVASEIRKFTNSRYRTVDLNIIKQHAVFLKDNYDIELIRANHSTDVDIKPQLENLLDFLKKQTKYIDAKVMDISKEVYDIPSESFIIDINLEGKLSDYWDVYISDYIKWMAESRINVKKALLHPDGSLCIDTDKKKKLILKHDKLNIKEMTFKNFIHLSLFKNTINQKDYGIHSQNMYIGFLLYLHSENKIILPFSYIFDVCYADKKVQVELPYYLSNHEINKKLLKAILENRLSIKDDKYKRIFQFILFSLPNNINIHDIQYKHLSSLLERNKNDFKRVVELLNILGANIVIDKPKNKYVDKYMKYSKIKKYKNLIELFNKTMNRAYKLGDYSREENVYKDWSGEYAKFFDFIETIYSNEFLSESFLYNIFNYPDEDKIITYQEYVENLILSSSTKERRFTPLIAAFNNDKYASLKNLKDKKPIFTDTSENKDSKKKRAPITNAIALETIEDILRNRPPKSNYFKVLNIDSKYTKWWKHYHYVAPFEAIILLMHLYIPARGINFRLSDRNTFLVKNDQGIVTGYHFTHDKNKKRKQAYIAPNIWGDDLKIVEDFIEYSKIHFENLKPVKYDKQNPHGIIPLFPNAKGTSFYTEDQHMKYWKRVLLKAQIELDKKLNEEKILLIYKNEPSINMPKSSEDVDSLSQGEMEYFTLRYDLHSLRHTGATKYANAGMPLGLLKLLTGHIDFYVLQSIYIQIDAERMIKEWGKIQNLNIGNKKLADAGSEFIAKTEIVIKNILLENNSAQLLEYLKKNYFISIGSYIGKEKLIQYTLEDFSKIDPIFWTFKRTGICTSTICLQGLENRCSLCPHFLTSPSFMHEISAQVNLQSFRLSKYVNMVIENRSNGKQSHNESIRTSSIIELEDLLAYSEILKTLDEEIVNKSIKSENESVSKELINSNIKQKSFYSVASIITSEHSLLKLVYDGLELKQFDHESMYDALEKLVSKLIRYAAKNGSFSEIDGKDKYEILEWFRPKYNDVLQLENGKTAFNESGFKILADLADSKLDVNSLKQTVSKKLEHKGNI